MRIYRIAKKRSVNRYLDSPTLHTSKLLIVTKTIHTKVAGAMSPIQ